MLQVARILGVVSAVVILSLAIFGAACASESTPAEEQTKFFDIKVPEAFKQDAVDESGVSRWSKGPATVYVVVGDLIAESGPRLFDELIQAAEKNQGLEKVTKIDIPECRAFTFIEQPPDSPTRLRSARLFVVTDRKMLYVDMSAPAQEFDALMSDFEGVVKSVKINSGK